MARNCRRSPIRARSISSFRNEKPPIAVHYADVSLAVIKLMGPGEYVLSRPGDKDQGHFALAAHDYTHSTAPNRRFADTVTQRLIKSVLAKQPPPYSDPQLDSIARNCTLKEDAARKVERVMNKRIAAVALQHRIGETFAAVVTGVTPKGVFVRVLGPARGRTSHSWPAGRGCGRSTASQTGEHGPTARVSGFCRVDGLTFWPEFCAGAST